MKITIENLEKLKEGEYVVFNSENNIVDIIDKESEEEGNGFWDFYHEFGTSSSKKIFEKYKNCEMFPLELINKPVETTNEQPEDNRCKSCIDENQEECGCEYI